MAVPPTTVDEDMLKRATTPRAGGLPGEGVRYGLFVDGIESPFA
jgi:hypothetical protein